MNGVKTVEQTDLLRRVAEALYCFQHTTSALQCRFVPDWFVSAWLVAPDCTESAAQRVHAITEKAVGELLARKFCERLEKWREWPKAVDGVPWGPTFGGCPSIRIPLGSVTRPDGLLLRSEVLPGSQTSARSGFRLALCDSVGQLRREVVHRTVRPWDRYGKCVSASAASEPPYIDSCMLEPNAPHIDPRGYSLTAEGLAMFATVGKTLNQDDASAAAPSGGEDTQAGKKPNHSLDFRSVSWFGNFYTFTATQAAIVRLLWESWKQGTPEISDALLLTKAEASNQARLSDLFKKNGLAHPAWSTMIVEGSTRGTRRLQETDPTPAKI